MLKKPKHKMAKAKRKALRDNDGKVMIALAVGAIVILGVFALVLFLVNRQENPEVTTATTPAPAQPQATKTPQPQPPPPPPPPSISTIISSSTGASGVLANLPWQGVEAAKRTIKGCKVDIVGDPASDEMYKKMIASQNTLTQNQKGYESAFKVEDTARPNSAVYYLSQFHAKPSESRPCAVSKETRAKYRTFAHKKKDIKGDHYFEKDKDPTTGHSCELITPASANVKTIQDAEAECKKDARCAGYYTATTNEKVPIANMRPVLASAAPSSCNVSWARLPASDWPKTQDSCNRYMGDGVWYGIDGVCEPTCPGDKGRTWTGLCYSVSNNSTTSDRCMDGWHLSSMNNAKYTCLPVTEKTCPIGWVLTDDVNYPNTGVCKPVCHKGAAQTREEDGYCHYDDSKGWQCLPGTGNRKYGSTDYCRPIPHDFDKK